MNANDLLNFRKFIKMPCRTLAIFFILWALTGTWKNV